MEIQAISYQGRTVAACTPNRFFLSDDLQHRPPDDPETAFVIAMAHFAHAVAHGQQPGPYTDQAAIRYARALLIPAELLDRAELDLAACSQWLCIPRDELQAAQSEHQAQRILAWLRLAE